MSARRGVTDGYVIEKTVEAAFVLGETLVAVRDVEAALAGLDKALGRLADARKKIIGSADAAPEGEPTQVGALQALAALVAEHPEVRANVEANERAYAYIRFPGADDRARMAGLVAYAASLRGHRDFHVACGEHTRGRPQVYVTGDHPGTREIQLVACLAGEPDAGLMDELRALCDPGGEVPAR